MCISSPDYCTLDLFEEFIFNMTHNSTEFTFIIETDLNVNKYFIF